MYNKYYTTEMLDRIYNIGKLYLTKRKFPVYVAYNISQFPGICTEPHKFTRSSTARNSILNVITQLEYESIVINTHQFKAR